MYNWMTGVYMIINPEFKIYVGKSANLTQRIGDHKRFSKLKKTKLEMSKISFGIDSHIIKIIKICEESELDYYERMYMDLFDSVRNGLNQVYNDKGRSVNYGK